MRNRSYCKLNRDYAGRDTNTNSVQIVEVILSILNSNLRLLSCILWYMEDTFSATHCIFEILKFCMHIEIVWVLLDVAQNKQNRRISFEFVWSVKNGV